MKPKFTTFQIADVNMCHVTKQDSQLMENPSIIGHLATADDSSGEYFAVLMDKDLFQDQIKGLENHGFSKEFLAIFQHLHDQEIPYVRFDAISDEVDGLPRFDW